MTKTTILDQIILNKKHWISNQKKKNTLKDLKSKVQISKRNFYNTLFKMKRDKKTIFILECKPASPSKGIICKNFNPTTIANIYKSYASVISVLTDTTYFHGNFNILYEISNIVTQPILCKDFFISIWQVYFARIHQADAILLMLSVLNDDAYTKLTNIAHMLNMGILTEITNENELNRAKSLGAKVIGINNRNLHNLSIELNRTINLSKKIPKSLIIISESGINNHSQIKQLRQYADGFLIGTALMSQNKLKTAINKLILGENKICGLTRAEDASIAYKLGSIYGGLIFVPNSTRYIDITIAQHIISSENNLCYVGVFCNATIEYIVNIVNTLQLSAVQLHGSEDQKYINILKTKLPITCHIWKSININKQTLVIPNLTNINRYLADNKEGGSGKTFDWSLIYNMQLNKLILAGGLTINNCAKAAQLGCLGLDFNSGVETTPGIKDHKKLIKIFQILHAY